VQVYRLEYPAVIPAIFNLQVEDGGYVDVPEFYLFAINEVNSRTTFAVNGIHASR